MLILAGPCYCLRSYTANPSNANVMRTHLTFFLLLLFVAVQIFISQSASNAHSEIGDRRRRSTISKNKTHQSEEWTCNLATPNRKMFASMRISSYQAVAPLSMMPPRFSILNQLPTLAPSHLSQQSKYHPSVSGRPEPLLGHSARLHSRFLHHRIRHRRRPYSTRPSSHTKRWLHIRARAWRLGLSDRGSGIRR